MDFVWSVAHSSILYTGAPIGFTDNTIDGSDVISPYVAILDHAKAYISNPGKKYPLYSFNPMGGQRHHPHIGQKLPKVRSTYCWFLEIWTID